MAAKKILWPVAERAESMAKEDRNSPGILREEVRNKKPMKLPRR
jgi:hypothetical protein